MIHRADCPLSCPFCLAERLDASRRRVFGAHANALAEQFDAEMMALARKHGVVASPVDLPDPRSAADAVLGGMLRDTEPDRTVSVTMDAMWETGERVPIGTVRRFDKAVNGCAGWGVAWKYSTVQATHRHGPIAVTVFLGAKLPDQPRNKFTVDGVDYDEPEPNWGVEEWIVEAAVRQFKPPPENRAMTNP